MANNLNLQIVNNKFQVAVNLLQLALFNEIQRDAFARPAPQDVLLRVPYDAVPFHDPVDRRILESLLIQRV